MITAETRVGPLLDAHPELIEFLADYHPHFGKLRNRLLRKVVAPRVTVADAARMAGLAPETLLEAVRQAVGEDAPAGLPAAAEPATYAATPMPATLRALDPRHHVRLDLRDDIARGEEPFARIMAAVKALGRDHALVLRVPFEPVPLYDVLGRRGLAHWTERRAADDWSVWFWREATAATPAETRAPAAPAGALDVRGLEPPQPMVLVLSRLDTLGPGETLEVLHDRRPLFLYPQLDARGFTHDTDEPAPGLVRIRIRHGTRTS